MEEVQGIEMYEDDFTQVDFFFFLLFLKCSIACLNSVQSQHILQMI